ncbi:sensor histidine kinase [Streptomyces sp. NPDC127106]|uniref:sensor histidine kinase n=1 Tax=Streptomyces sp. NPDC127106 TaxID=3345360 RepID=UPI00363F3C50
MSLLPDTATLRRPWPRGKVAGAAGAWGAPDARASYADAGAGGFGSPALQANALQALCRRVFAFRMLAIGLGAPLALGRTAPGGPTYLVAGAILLTFMLSYALFRDWERLGPLLLRHRWLLACDMALSGLLLVTATPASPLGFVSLCTPLLAGLVYGWRGSAVYAALQAVAVAALPGGLTLPVLCLVAGAAGSSLRDLLFRFGAASRALTETRARLAVAEAVRAERERLARDMHDSVAKTLHGLALAADALARTDDPDAVRRRAGLLSDAARQAATESRALLADLRQETDTPGVHLPPELHRLAAAQPGPAGAAGAAAAEVTTSSSGTLPLLPPPVARHLLAVAAEAVDNARRHADATHIHITLTAATAAETAHLTLTVEDDGRGLPADGPDLAALRGAGHYGLLGMAEHAAAVGARLHLGPADTPAGPGRPGTRIRVDLPLAALTPEGSP